MSLELAHTPGLRRRVKQLLAQYHYRGFNGAVGDYAEMGIMLSCRSN
jgi:hypothetical protein